MQSYDEITTLPKDLREKLQNIPWLSVLLETIQESKIDETKKALLKLDDGEIIETVLMKRSSKKIDDEDESRYTVCISTQVGCPMGCAFCSTGAMGFKRNLTAQEIIDQVRFWQRYIYEHEADDARIGNIVLMGQGEPLLNYDNVKEALSIFLAYTDIGPRKITLSTVGVPDMMDKMIADQNFPPVRFALSLHSAIEETREQIIRSHKKGFLDFIIEWSKKYHERFGTRTHFIGLEYTLLEDINDDEKHIKALITLASQLGRIRINLIPYNDSDTSTSFTASPQETIKYWHDRLIKAGFTATIRHSQGQDIAAACGQLRNSLKH